MYGVFAHILTNACMCKERKLSFYLGPLFIGCFCLAPPSFLRQSLCEPGAHYSILHPLDLPVFTTPGVGLQNHAITPRFYTPAEEPVCIAIALPTELFPQPLQEIF